MLALPKTDWLTFKKPGFKVLLIIVYLLPTGN